jgi:hypothetical protein
MSEHILSLLRAAQIGAYPHRLRVTFSNESAMTRFDVRRFQSIFSECKHLVVIDDAIYVGFRDFPSIARTFDACSSYNFYSRRMLDPYAIRVTFPRHLGIDHIRAHFEHYGMVTCIVDHASIEGSYAFVNFMRRESSLLVLNDGPIHCIRGMLCNVRAKTLSVAKPFFPKPYSPARRSYGV